MTFTDLQGFSNYRLTLTATFDSFGTEENAVTTTDFMTPSAGRLGHTQSISCFTDPAGLIFCSLQKKMGALRWSTNLHRRDAALLEEEN